jgi:uncharacterized membrane protein HdeD (DUF308 family)
VIAGGLVVLLGAVLALAPVTGREASVQLTGLILLAAAMLEFFVGLTSSRPSVRRIEILLSCVTLGAVLLILLRPDAYPLAFVAAICLAVRGVGATVAAIEPDRIRGWVLARGISDLALTTILMVGAPLAAVISVISGVPWPPRGAVVLTNFLAVSTIISGLSLVALALRNRVSGDT